MDRKRRSEITALFDYDVETLWKVVTDSANSRWRSDLERTEVSRNNTFVEYSTNGQTARCKTVECRYLDFYTVSVSSVSFFGKRKYEFFREGPGKSKMICTGEILYRNHLLKALSFLGTDLRKMQESYITDLRKELARNHA